MHFPGEIVAEPPYMKDGKQDSQAFNQEELTNIRRSQSGVRPHTSRIPAHDNG